MDTPAITKEIQLVKPRINDFDLFTARARQIFESGWLTNNGPFLTEFETKLSKYLGLPCTTVSNATLGLLLALKGLNLKGNVIVPSYTFCATVHALEWLGLEPNFVDIDRETFNLDPQKVEEAVNEKTSAILGVHLFGNPCDIDRLQEISIKHNLTLLFDAAQAIGASYKGVKIGNFGKAEIFSTHATKALITAEGGFISTKDENLRQYIDRAKNFGITDVVDTSLPGLNAKLSEVHAIIGLDSLEGLEMMIAKRKQLSSWYQHYLGTLPGIKFQKIQPEAESGHFFFPVVIDPMQFGLSRDDLAKELKERGIQTRYYLPVHKQKTYQHYTHKELPNTDYIGKNTLFLPMHAELSPEEVQRICESIAQIRNAAIASGHQNSETKEETKTEKTDDIKNVLVTGGAGYVGCVLIKKLLQEGYYVRVLDQLIFGKEPLSEFNGNPNFDLRVGVVEDKYMIEKCIKDIDAVIHLSGLSNDPSCEIDAELTRKYNIEATKVLLAAAKKEGVKRFIYASSCSAYGFTNDNIVTEETPPTPLTAYAKSKVESENIILPEGNDNFVTVCLRKATIYGPSPRMRFDLVINTMTGMAVSEGRIVINGGNQWRPFLHVEDAAEAYLFMLRADKKNINGQIFNVGSDQQNVRIIDLAHTIAGLLPGTRVEQSHSPDSRSYHVSFTKLNALGWKATHTIEEGVKEIKRMFDTKQVTEFRDLNYFNIKRIVTYLNI